MNVQILGSISLSFAWMVLFTLPALGAESSFRAKNASNGQAAVEVKTGAAGKNRASAGGGVVVNGVPAQVAATHSNKQNKLAEAEALSRGGYLYVVPKHAGRVVARPHPRRPVTASAPIGETPQDESVPTVNAPAPAPQRWITPVYLMPKDKNPRSAERSAPIVEANGPPYDEDAPLLDYQRKEAEKGNPQSQYALGLRYLSGIGVEKDETLAREWLKKASAGGNLKARAKLRELMAGSDSSSPRTGS